ncbi:MAG: phage holin family protein [Candidatus Wildermuthbacteria bacterium]|nr:phage holin family protein [Candidatus Wildermuthbacteria bacterium]
MPQSLDFLGTTQMQFIVILIGVDVILGILGSVVKKEFRFGKLAKFMHAPVLGYIFGFAVLSQVAAELPQLAFVAQGAYILIIVALIASVFRNLNKLGLPLPGAEKM